MKKTLTYKGVVMTWECDSNRHMNVMYYMNKFELAGHSFVYEMGLEEFGGNDKIGVVALNQIINYYKEVHEDDLLYIESILVEIRNKAFTILHKMYNQRTKEMVSDMTVSLVLFDKINRKAIPFPAALKVSLLQ